MTIDTYGVMRSMIDVYTTLHPRHCGSRSVVWEMNTDTADALQREASRLDRPGIFPHLPLPEGDVELQCLGIRVSVVERPGVRLVIEAVSG